MLRYLLGYAVLLALVVPAAAQVKPEEVLDHYACYFVVEPVEFTGPPTLELIDQFYSSPPAKAPVTQRELLCNPVHKEGSQVKFPSVHLICYGLQKNETPFKVRVSNQFGAAGLSVTVDRFLCVPTGKSTNLRQIPPDPDAAKKRLVDHFKCYLPARNPEIGKRVHLSDQFNKNVFATVGEAIALCNPTEKVIDGKQKGYMLHLGAHLVCYQLLDQRFALEKAPHFNWPDVRVAVHNQFEATEVNVKTEPVVLCVPSTKSRE